MVCMTRAAQAKLAEILDQPLESPPIKQESHENESQSAKQPAKQPLRKKRAASSTVPHLTEDGNDGEAKHEPAEEVTQPIAKPKRSRKQKPAKVEEVKSQGPRYMIVTPDMLRPPGEKHPVQIWDVPKRKYPTNLIPMLVTDWTPPFIWNIRKLKPGEPEVRVLPSNDTPSEWYEEAYHRATTQRLFMIERTRDVESECHAGHFDCPIEIIRIAGTTGNVYTVYISHQPTCTCPDNRMRKRACKHISYVLHHVLKAPARLCHQEAFLTSELKEIAAAAPPIPTTTTNEAVVEPEAETNRKPVSDDCPICCQEFEQEKEDIVWCQSSCGNNMHKNCFEQWSRAKASHREVVTCPFCRAPWQMAKATALLGPQSIASNVILPEYTTAAGYINVRDQLAYD